MLPSIGLRQIFPRRVTHFPHVLVFHRSTDCMWPLAKKWLVSICNKCHSKPTQNKTHTSCCHELCFDKRESALYPNFCGQALHTCEYNWRVACTNHLYCWTLCVCPTFRFQVFKFIEGLIALGIPNIKHSTFLLWLVFLCVTWVVWLLSLFLYFQIWCCNGSKLWLTVGSCVVGRSFALCKSFHARPPQGTVGIWCSEYI